MATETYYGVYRVLKDGSHRYMPRTATNNENLAREIAASYTRGELTMPDGSAKRVKRIPCCVKPIK